MFLNFLDVVDAVYKSNLQAAWQTYFNLYPDAATKLMLKDVGKIDGIPNIPGW